MSSTHTIAYNKIISTLGLQILAITLSVAGNQENETIKKLSILEELYTNFFEIMTKEKNSFALESVVRLSSFLHYGATTEVPVTKERTIFFFPSIEGNEIPIFSN